MCGIAGIWGEGNIQPMVDILTHRGPDEEGIYRSEKVRLGVRRLKVIDLETGSQPIYNEDKSLVIVYNGEVFNYLELREDLQKHGHRFRTKTDTEVVLHAYEQWGEGCLEKLNGQFAFCIYDGKKLFIARDRMGEKPLYYYNRHGRFLFASEIKAILTQLATTPQIDETFWIFDSSVQGRTMFKDIHELPQACYLTFDGERTRTTSYWEIPSEPDDVRPDDELASELRDLLEDAIRIRMRADVPVGLFLSGGVDSAAIACFARPDIVFTCRFELGEKFDEFRYAKIVADHIGAEQIVVSPTAEDMRRHLGNIMWHLDQPIATASSLSEFMLAKTASKYVKVILGGQGADELFGGYVRYLLLFAEQDLAKKAELLNYYSLARFFWTPQMFADPGRRYYHLIHRASPVDDEPYIRMVQDLFSKQSDVVNAMGFTDIHLSLPSLITMNDRAAAAAGLENRCPFLDHRLVEFAFRLPGETKIREFRTKRILRKALQGVVPEAILERRDKKGLVVPFQQWFSGPLYEWGRELEAGLHRRIVVPGGAGRGEFDRATYTRVCLELWFQQFFPDYADR
jgi:asparagine synthase (glutamine-hydrolysing)